MAKKSDITLHPTKNTMNENTRGAMVGLLQKHFGTAIDLSYSIGPKIGIDFQKARCVELKR